MPLILLSICLLLGVDVLIIILYFIFLIVYILTFIPHLAVAIRRLHDTDRSGLYYLLVMVPFGIIILLFLLVDSGTMGKNKFGEYPY